MRPPDETSASKTRTGVQPPPRILSLWPQPMGPAGMLEAERLQKAGRLTPDPIVLPDGTRLSSLLPRAVDCGSGAGGTTTA